MELRSLARSDERIFWEGRPKEGVTVLEAVFNPLLPIAVFWAAFDLLLMGPNMLGGIAQGDATAFPLFLFFLLHMMPVWIYLGGVIFAGLRWKNTHFMITERGMYVSGGIFSFHYEMKPWVDISHVRMHQGIFDRMFGVGDVISVCGHTDAHGGQGMKIYNIPDYVEVFRLVNDLQRDIYSDTMYPNDLRPETNGGYRTRYTRR